MCHVMYARAQDTIKNQIGRSDYKVGRFLYKELPYFCEEKG